MSRKNPDSSNAWRTLKRIAARTQDELARSMEAPASLHKHEIGIVVKLALN